MCAPLLLNVPQTECPDSSGWRSYAPHKKSPRRRLTIGGSKKRLAARYFPTLLNVVSSPQGALTAVFGMGTGVSPPPVPPTKMNWQPEREQPHESKAICRIYSPLDSGIASGSRGGWRPGLTAYQKWSVKSLATLRPPSCQPGVLPGAFRGLATRDGTSSGGLGT